MAEVKLLTWFNPPYSANVRNNVGKEFLNLLNRAFPQSSPLHNSADSQVITQVHAKYGTSCGKAKYETVERRSKYPHKHKNAIAGGDPQIAQRKVNAKPKGLYIEQQ